MSAGRYMELLQCRTPDEVYTTVRSWISGLTDHEHLVRSTILDIHADVERVMKQTLYQALVGLVFRGDDESEYEKHRQGLERMVTKLNFATAHRLLKPCFDAYPAAELADIGRINDVRNDVAHRKAPSEVAYRDRNPFTDPDCLAQLYLDGWAIRSVIEKLVEVMITDPCAYADRYAEFYRENYARLKKGDS